VNFLVSDDAVFWNSERILAVVSGSSIFLYAIYELQEWLKERGLPSIHSLIACCRGKPVGYSLVQSKEKTAISSRDKTITTAVQLAKAT
jgi:hypothetical protein